MRNSDSVSHTQEGIDRAFAGKQRRSNLIYKYRSSSVVMLSGKNTNRLGVEEITGPNAEIVQTTNLERTLIDIVVRMSYAGGPSQTLAAYQAAKDRVSISDLIKILQQIDYVYPYHQSIGFLMQKANYLPESYEQLRSLGLEHDFYLMHAIPQPAYSKEWRIYYPQGLSL